MRLFAAAACVFFLSAAEGENVSAPTLQEYLETAERFRRTEASPRTLPDNALLKWECREEYRILYSDMHFFSFSVKTEGYDGGGHGWSRTTVGTVCRGRRMELSDLSGCIGLELRWRQAICRYFETERWEECLSRSITPPRMTENFYADDAGLHFLYDPGTLAWRAAGIVDIFVPWTPEERKMPEKFSSLR